MVLAGCSLGVGGHGRARPSSVADMVMEQGAAVWPWCQGTTS